MTKDEALKLALEALKQIDEAMPFPVAKLAQKVIKEALAQPEQDGQCKRCTDGCPACDARKLSEQEPVAWRAWVSKFPQGTGSDWVYVTKPIMKDSIHNQPLYTTPPQRKPLTDEEIAETLTGYRLSDAIDITRAIEAAHGIKEST